MQVPEDERSPAERARATQETERRATLSDVLERAGEAYRKHLKGAPRAVVYLNRRGLSGQVARDFGLGYAPEGWRTLASVFPDYGDPLLEESGLVITGEDGEDKRYDRFRDRIMFPIRSVKGEVIGFGGRVLGDEKPKYLNSPETPVFHKGRELYGLFEARSALREHGYALVTEGYMDVVALAQLGFGNAVATLGTACTPEHVQKLFRFTDSVVFSFDGDAAGRRAARKALEAALPFASDVRSVKFLFLPAEHDPDSFIRAEGAEAFGAAVRAAVPLSRFLLDAAAEGCDLGTAEGRSHFAANAQPLWRLLPTGALAQQLLGEIAQQVQIGTHELEDLWGLHRKPTHSRSGERYERGPGRDKRVGASPSPAWRPAPRAASRTRVPPSSRATRALEIALSEPETWDSLSQSDHTLLCDLPEPHGPLFTWLAGQVLDHGAQPWGALREALREHPYEAFAVERMSQQLPDIVPEASELHDILAKLRKDHLQALATAALEAGEHERYQALMRESVEPGRDNGSNSP